MKLGQRVVQFHIRPSLGQRSNIYGRDRANISSKNDVARSRVIRVDGRCAVGGERAIYCEGVDSGRAVVAAKRFCRRRGECRVSTASIGCKCFPAPTLSANLGCTGRTRAGRSEG